MQTKKKEVMSSEISIKLNVAGMVTGVDVENNDFLDEEQVVEGSSHRSRIVGRLSFRRARTRKTITTLLIISWKPFYSQ